uniref:Uncharacterized protein n=1 Tax=Arundo donax TaxID=35708 RepID=A0A0A8YXC3_ARUDO
MGSPEPGGPARLRAPAASCAARRRAPAPTWSAGSGGSCSHAAASRAE